MPGYERSMKVIPDDFVAFNKEARADGTNLLYTFMFDVPSTKSHGLRFRIPRYVYKDEKLGSKYIIVTTYDAAGDGNAKNLFQEYNVWAKKRETEKGEANIGSGSFTDGVWKIDIDRILDGIPAGYTRENVEFVEVELRHPTKKTVSVAVRVSKT